MTDITTTAEEKYPLFDVARARRDTPACQHVAHFNNAGMSLTPAPVLDAVVEHLRLEAEIGGYEAEDQAHPRIRRTYDALAEMLHCHTGELALMDNATRAWDMAFYALPLEPGDRILTNVVNYGSNHLAMLQRAQQTGAVIEVLPTDEYGAVDLPRLGEILTGPRIRLLAITHVPTNGGLVESAQAIGQLAQESGTPYLLDACQSAGQMPLNVEELGCDMLSATGRKYLRGPRGTGFLYVRHEMLPHLQPPFVDMVAATWVSPGLFHWADGSRRFETFEKNVAGVIGLGVAVDYALEWGLDAISAWVTMLAAHLRSELQRVPGLTVRDLGRTQCGIVTFTLHNRHASAVYDGLKAERINVWVSGEQGALLDMQARGLVSVCRASLHYYNTEDEIARLCAALMSL